MTRTQKIRRDGIRHKAKIDDDALFLSIAHSIEQFKPEHPAVEAILTPQVIVTLSLDRSGLQVELPGANGSRRVVALDSRHIFEHLLRLLLAQADRRIEIGLDGAPTQAQARHWRHLSPDGGGPSDTCKFCLADGLISRGRAPRGNVIAIGDGSATVRRLSPRGKARQGSQQQRIRQTLEEIGL